jgi:16S rRNA (adenine1518-N6/adenine1519-N6)-dimethyltransferase
MLAPESITLLVQAEVAGRIASESKKRSLLWVMANYYAAVTLGPRIGKHFFDPVPKVESQVVRLVPYKNIAKTEDKEFFRIVKIGFAAKRKTLVNNLRAGLQQEKEVMEKLVTEIGLAPNIRPEGLSVADWRALFVACQKFPK